MKLLCRISWCQGVNTKDFCCSACVLPPPFLKSPTTTTNGNSWEQCWKCGNLGPAPDRQDQNLHLISCGDSRAFKVWEVSPKAGGLDTNCILEITLRAVKKKQQQQQLMSVSFQKRWCNWSGVQSGHQKFWKPHLPKVENHGPKKENKRTGKKRKPLP